MASAWVQEYFKSSDGSEIFFRFFPVPNARHTLLIIHGYGEHSGRYEKFAAALGRASVQIAVMDLRGMGLSRGEEGRSAELQVFLEDFSAFANHLQTKFGIPRNFILLGHSLGGLFAIHWALGHPDRVKRLILSAPFLGLKAEWLCFPLNRWIYAVKPDFVYRNPVYPKSLTHDPAEVALYRKDRLIHRKMSAGFLDEVLRSMKQLRARTSITVPFPVYLMTAGDERIVDPVATVKFFNRLVAPHKEQIHFDGFYHEIFNEVEQKKAFNVLKTIIEDCV